MRFLVLLLCTTFLFGCQPDGASNEAKPPTGQGDPEAIELAREVLEASGGQEALDQNRYIAWTFFGRRDLIWDTQNDRVRVEVIGEPKAVVLHIPDTTGSVFLDGVDVQGPEEKEKQLKWAYSAWINDSYWLMMPFKMLDPGVILRYEGKGETPTGEEAEILNMTFEEVGLTPQNKYRVYVDPATKLVTYWEYFATAQDSVPRLKTPWQGYEDYNGLKLAGDRGTYGLTPIYVFQEMPETVFSQQDTISRQQMQEIGQ